MQLVAYDRWHAIDFILSIATLKISLGKGNWTLVREEVSNVPRVIAHKDGTAIAAMSVHSNLADVGYLLLAESMGNCLSNVCLHFLVA